MASAATVKASSSHRCQLVRVTDFIVRGQRERENLIGCDVLELLNLAVWPDHRESFDDWGAVETEVQSRIVAGAVAVGGLDLRLQLSSLCLDNDSST